MNRIRSILYTSIRTYARGVRGKRKNAVVEEEVDYGINKEELELLEDPDEYESDFMNVGQSYDDYEREERITKEKLKYRIVASKYFKQDPDPKFLTFIEKDEIKRLHNMDPQEWTIERLSESFPALPETIKKIVRAKSIWVPESVDVIMKYDTHVNENWKKFNAGRLAVSPALKEHLMKFKGRKISFQNRKEMAEKLVRPPPKFEKPKSQLFTSIVANYIEENSNRFEQKQLPMNDDIQKNRSKFTNTTNIGSHLSNIENYRMESQNIKAMHNNVSVTINNNEHTEKSRKETLNSFERIYEKPHKAYRNKKLITFNEFAKNKLKELYEMSPEEGITLGIEYKKYLEKYEQKNTEKMEKISVESSRTTGSQNFDDSSKNRDTRFNENNSKTKDSSDKSRITNDETESKDLEVLHNLNSTEISTELKADEANVEVYEQPETTLDTHIKEWNIKLDEGENFDAYIKIPKKMHKQGMLYRIRDCYYDDDGEFLFRVPGLRN